MTSPQSGLQQPYVAQRQNDLAGLNQGQYPSKNRSASSLTYDRSYSHHQQGPPQQSSQQHPQPPYPINNGLNGPPQSLSLDPQQPQAPYPQQRRQLRKAPSSNLPPIQNDQVYNSPDARRIVSTPNHQQNFPTPVPLEARTQSLTSMSFKINNSNNNNNNNLH